jgi:class 3 adenylate cyclase/tetratricopeptide (TPR) repeat protein
MELLAGRDPEEARQLLDPVLERMMEAVHHYEGTVNQVLGDGIMALFGAPLAHEDHAVRACYAALRMQEQVGRYGDEVQRTHGVPVQIRVGLNSGDVVVRSIGNDLHMDYTAVGQTTHLAARMEQMAKPGSTLLTSATLRLAEGYVRVRGLGPVPIKGLAEPVVVWELLGAAAARTRLQVSATRGLTRFVGRDPELEQMRTALERARGGRGQIVAVVGEPGVGKSRLVWELVHSHRTEGWLVLQCSSVSYGKTTTFLPVIDIMKTYFGLEDRDDPRRVREKLTGKLLTLDEALRPTLPALQSLLDVAVEDAAWLRLSTEQQRSRMVDAVRGLLLRESQEQPVLLVVEDLHWIDGDTQALLELLVESVPSHRVVLLLNYRPEYRHGWGGKTYYAQIRLDPLPPETVDTLLDALLGDDRGLGPLRALLIARAQGNPLFLEESVRALVETGVLAGDRGAYRLAQATTVVQMPATVQAILEARIDRLAPADKTLLQAASVVGKDVPLPLLQAIAGLDDDELARGVDRLQSAEFLYQTRLFPEPEYTFKHALTHEVAYTSLLNERRRALHRQTVEAIERLHAGRLAEHRDRLVHHAFRGEMWSRALRYLRHADEVASPDQIEEVMGVGAESAGPLWWTGQHERAIRAAERDLAIAASFGNFGMRVVNTCRLAQGSHALGDYRRAIELLRQIVASLQGDLVVERFGMTALPSVWARSWLAWCLAERGEFDEGLAVGEEGAAIADAADDPHSRGQAAFGLGMLHVVRAAPECAIAVLEQGLVIVRLAGIPFLVPFLTGPLGAAYALAGRADPAVALLEQTVEQAAAMRLMAHHALRLTWLGHARLVGGRHDVALEQARRALRIAEDGKERGHQAYAHRLLGEVLARRDRPDLDAAEAEYGHALALAEPLGMKPLIAACHEAVARLRNRATP